MPLLNDLEMRKIQDSVKVARFTDNRKQVPAWSLRFVALAVCIFFLVITIITLSAGGNVFIFPLILSVCWLFVAFLFHLQWVRYTENYILHNILNADKHEDDNKLDKNDNATD
jgi:fatty acid desaturase